MPIHLDKTDCKPHCLKYLWSIKHDKGFVASVAQLALGQHRHVLRVVRSLGPSRAYAVGSDEISDLIRRLEQDGPGQVENRDGWLFQLISWIALAIQMNKTAVIDPPHIMESQKGFDGLCVGFSDAKDALDYLLVTEDKATTSPRDVFRNDVLPEIKRIEAGALNSQMRSRVSVLVSVAISDEADRERVLKAVLWQTNLRFRTCFATQAEFLPKHVELFKGYADAAPGAIERRQGGLLLVPDLRPWFDSLAKQVISELQALKTS